ncbi:hypothetical protein F1642_13590 [Paracoccus sp. NBH48]|uniref:hypothetical protein n=1 Tax=Paracoccus sp. NBH48 TaxID=2596918 RepID=UPI001890DE94|nr:hypothetical protein [Paracoccus sp. NBH48]MBF5079963.1 hypothetical protein [Paracoccus sp. NBH48]
MLTILGLLAVLAPPAPAVPPPADVHLVQMQQDSADRMWCTLDLAALMPILQEEAVTEAARMEGEGLIAGGGLPWARVVARIHDTPRMEALFRAGVRGRRCAHGPTAGGSGTGLSRVRLGPAGHPPGGVRAARPAGGRGGGSGTGGLCPRPAQR